MTSPQMTCGTGSDRLCQLREPGFPCCDSWVTTEAAAVYHVLSPLHQSFRLLLESNFSAMSRAVNHRELRLRVAI